MSPEAKRPAYASLPNRRLSRLLDRVFPGRISERERREFFAEFNRSTTCATCGHGKTVHSVVLDGSPCRMGDCGCRSFVWPEASSRESS